VFGKKKEEGMFDETPALRAAATAFHAMTQEKNWSKASAAYLEAYQMCGSSTVQELALRGEVCLWYGFALKNLFDLESISDRNPPTQDRLKAVTQIRRLWTEMLGIYAKLPYDYHRLDSRIVEQIRSHWIMPE
jgi:hypothetical protein